MTEPVIKDDPFGIIKNERKDETPAPRDVNYLHTRADTDSSTFAAHHTLGINHNQASPGDHNHDAKGSRKIGTGLGIIVTGAKGGNAALTSLIAALKQVFEFTDSTT